MKHGILTLYSRPPSKRRVCEGLLLKYSFFQFYWELLLENMEFMSCHVDERKAQSSHVASE